MKIFNTKMTVKISIALRLVIQIRNMYFYNTDAKYEVQFQFLQKNVLGFLCPVFQSLSVFDFIIFFEGLILLICPRIQNNKKHTSWVCMMMSCRVWCCLMPVTTHAMHTTSTTLMRRGESSLSEVGSTECTEIESGDVRLDMFILFLHNL